MDFLNPAGMNNASQVQQPRMLDCELKKYQLKGLQWLANLYDQGINGILAGREGTSAYYARAGMCGCLSDVCR